MKVTTDACLFGAWCAGELKKAKVKMRNALDIGTGTSLLSLMVAQKNGFDIDAIEIDGGAAKQASENVAASPWQSQIIIHHADAVTWEDKQRYDCIFSNPPFYENELRSGKSQKNIAHHDAGLTLQQLFRVLNDRLNDSGSFFLLLPAKREKELDAILRDQQFFLHKKIVVRQTAKHQPFRIMIQAGRFPIDELSEEITIKDENDHYSPEFVALLKDYYLYL
jgi:tRNA1Val (adenine37-N6)-methyltransferase